MVQQPHHANDRVRLAALVVATLFLLSCESPQRVVDGECRDVYGADVCTWASFSGSELLELGVTFPLDVADGVPEEMEMVWPPAPIAILAMPAEAAQLTGITHFELNWEHHGHPPPTFMEPHFDFHFYTIGSDEISRIDCNDVTKPQRLPPGFVLPDATDPELGVLTGLCVPSMGMHAMRSEELASSEPFSATMLIGYYGGELIFVEPMISRARLLEEENFSLEIPPLAEYTDMIRYPTSFHAEFDPSRRSYRMVFTDFALR